MTPVPSEPRAGLQTRTFVLLLVVVTLAFGMILRPFWAAVFWGVIIAILFAPLQRLLVRKIGSKTGAAIATLAIILLIVTPPLVLVVGALVQEGSGVYARIRSGELNFGRHFQEIVSALPPWFNQVLDRFGISNFADIQQQLTSAVTQASQLIATQVLGVGQNTLQFVVSFFIALYLAFFLLRDGSSLAARVKEAIPLNESHKQALADKFATVIRATIKGNIAIAVIQGTLGGLALWVLDVRGALLWAVLMAFLSLLPAVGAGLIWAPVALVLVPCLVLVVSGVVRNRLRPVTRLAAEVDRRSEDDLTPLPLEGIPTEIRPFAASIGRLLSRLQQAIDNQRRFVADAAHELRSPLTAVSLQAQALAASNLPAVSKEPLLRLQTGLLRAGALIDQLLTLARSQARQPEPENAVSVSSVVHAVIEDLMLLAESRSIDLGMVRHDTAAVHALQADLYAIVRNLIDNAVRYSPRGSRVDVAVERDGARVLLQVVNEGPGIPQSEQERVFDPFHRMLGTDSEGSGLGLAIVRTLVERGGGAIELQDASAVAGAHGVCVQVWLPAADAGRYSGTGKLVHV